MFEAGHSTTTKTTTTTTTITTDDNDDDDGNIKSALLFVCSSCFVVGFIHAQYFIYYDEWKWTTTTTTAWCVGSSSATNKHIPSNHITSHHIAGWCRCSMLIYEWSACVVRWVLHHHHHPHALSSKTIIDNNGRWSTFVLRRRATNNVLWIWSMKKDRDWGRDRTGRDGSYSLHTWETFWMKEKERGRDRERIKIDNNRNNRQDQNKINNSVVVVVVGNAVDYL